MVVRWTWPRSVLGVALAATLVCGASIVGSASRVAAAARGFDGTTVTVGGLGLASNFQPGASNGAEARIKAFNDDNEIKGVKIEFDEFTDDKQEPGNCLERARRRLVPESVFAIVPTCRSTSPATTSRSRRYPCSVGDSRQLCTRTARNRTRSCWAFGWNGCQNNPEAPVAPDGGKAQLRVHARRRRARSSRRSPLVSERPAGQARRPPSCDGLSTRARA